MAHYTYLQHIVENPDWQKFISAIVLGGAMIGIGSVLTKRLATADGVKQSVIPSEKLSVFGFVDFAFEKWVLFQDSILGKEYREHAPFTATLFFFILFANLLGLVPGIPAITTSVWINVGMALVVFWYFNSQGVKAHGVVGYLKHFAGPLWWLAWLIFPLEILSTTLRILTLNLRLYWNINADHIVLGVFTELVPFIVPVVFFALGTFVAFMQAFVFSLLTMVYIQLASHHEEGEDH